MDGITLKIGWIILVESIFPPIPTSITARSAFYYLKKLSPSNVTYSK